MKDEINIVQHGDPPPVVILAVLALVLRDLRREYKGMGWWRKRGKKGSRNLSAQKEIADRLREIMDGLMMELEAMEHIDNINNPRPKDGPHRLTL